jgi:hypothetical protein
MSGTMMTKRDWLELAAKRHQHDAASPFWREHWKYTLFARGQVQFTGSYDACIIAAEAFRTEPYTISDITGRAAITNR